MKGFRMIFAAVALLSAVVFVSAQSKKTSKKSAPIKPYLVAVSVANMDESVKWYKDNLGFETKRVIDLPKYSLRITFLELNDFQLELIEFKQSVSYDEIKKQFPAIDDRAKIQGFGKLAFSVENIYLLAATLKKNKVNFIHEVTTEKDTNQKWFIVTDNSGNWIQFFQNSK